MITLKGTPVVLSQEAGQRRLINVPAGVKRWKIKTRAGWAARLILVYEDRTEWRVLFPVGCDCMEAGFIQGANVRRVNLY